MMGIALGCQLIRNQSNYVLFLVHMPNFRSHIIKHTLARDRNAKCIGGDEKQTNITRKMTKMRVNMFGADGHKTISNKSKKIKSRCKK